MPEEHVFALTVEASGEVTPAADQPAPEPPDADATEPEEAER